MHDLGKIKHKMFLPSVEGDGTEEGGLVDLFTTGAKNDQSKVLEISEKVKIQKHSLAPHADQLPKVLLLFMPLKI